MIYLFISALFPPFFLGDCAEFLALKFPSGLTSLPESCQFLEPYWRGAVSPPPSMSPCPTVAFKRRICGGFGEGEDHVYCSAFRSHTTNPTGTSHRPSPRADGSSWQKESRHCVASRFWGHFVLGPNFFFGPSIVGFPPVIAISVPFPIDFFKLYPGHFLTPPPPPTPGGGAGGGVRIQPSS